jgi:hypothetical protein
MRKDERTQEKILAAFARAVAAGEMEKAEGWLAVALWTEGVSEKATPVPAQFGLSIHP